MAVTSRWRAVPAAAGRLDDEDIARVHGNGVRGAEFLARTLLRVSRALDPVPARCARPSSRETERGNAATIGEDHRRHRLEKADAAFGTIAAAMTAGAAAAAPDRVRVEPDRKAPFEHLGIREAGV